MDNNQPIFQPIFGAAWATMPPVFHKHYANRPFSDDVGTVEGKMDVEFGWLTRLLSPLLRLTGALVPYQGKDIPTTVHFRSESDTTIYCFDRIFHFPGREPYHFRSRMLPVGGNEVVEYMRGGIGWRAAYVWENGKVKLKHRGYALQLFGRPVPIPLGLLLGKGYAEEEAISDTSFRMYMDIRHPLWGKVYDYRGVFEMKEI
jgi:hypothetical protein